MTRINYQRELLKCTTKEKKEKRYRLFQPNAFSRKFQKSARRLTQTLSQTSGDDFHRSNMRENHHDFSESVFFPPSHPPVLLTLTLPLSPSRRSLCPRQTIVRIVLCAATENLQSSLDCAQGLLWRSPPPTHVRPLSPAGNPCAPTSAARRSTTKRV